MGERLACEVRRPLGTYRLRYAVTCASRKGNGGILAYSSGQRSEAARSRTSFPGVTRNEVNWRQANGPCRVLRAVSWYGPLLGVGARGETGTEPCCCPATALLVKAIHVVVVADSDLQCGNVDLRIPGSNDRQAHVTGPKHGGTPRGIRRVSQNRLPVPQKRPTAREHTR